MNNQQSQPKKEPSIYDIIGSRAESTQELTECDQLHVIKIELGLLFDFIYENIQGNETSKQLACAHIEKAMKSIESAKRLLK